MTKSFVIPKELVWRAWLSVKANKGTYGIDKQSIEDFERNLGGNLYKLWNRMSSGTYFPPPVRGVDIPKKQGGVRTLGIPAVSDRVAQTVAKLVLELQLDPKFHPSSYGYRPGKSAHDAIGATRQQCWKFDFVLEFDIRGMFDNIPWDLILKALKHHTNEPWIILYVKRWLEADLVKGGQEIVQRTKGTPQGGVVSPILMNLYMHYAFDLWMGREFPELPWCRYADDGLVHCKSAEQAELVKMRLQSRLSDCGLEIHPDKTKVVYCADANRRASYPNTKFTFLSYDFCARPSKSGAGIVFMSFTATVSKAALKRMRRHIKYQLKLGNRVDLSLEQIAAWINPITRGWIQYYGKFHRSALRSIAKYIEAALARWVCRKYITIKARKDAYCFLSAVRKRQPTLLGHWVLL